MPDDALALTLEALRQDIARSVIHLDHLIESTQARSRALEAMSRHEVHEIARRQRSRPASVSASSGLKK